MEVNDFSVDAESSTDCRIMRGVLKRIADSLLIREAGECVMANLNGIGNLIEVCPSLNRRRDR